MIQSGVRCVAVCTWLVVVRRWARQGLSMMVATLLIGGTATVARAAEKYALVIGVENYIPDQLPALDYAEDDANALGNALTDLGFGVIAMTSQAKNPLQRPSTAAQIMEQVGRRLEDRQPADTVVLAFSGHGVQFKGSREIYFCPEQADLSRRDSLVPMSRVMAEIGRCGAGRKLVLVDACRDELTPASAAKSGVAIELEAAGVFRAEAPRGTVAIFSCKAREKSYELRDLGHSVFTHHVVEYLARKAPADRYPGGELGVLDLAGYVSSRTRETVDVRLSRRQTPEWVVPDGSISDWPLGSLGGNQRPAGSDLASVERKPAMAKPAMEKPVPPPPPSPSPTPKPVPPIAGGGGPVVENSIGMKLVRIEAGEFEMGSNEISDDEKPIHRVRITKPFLLGQTEVTQGQFEKVMGQAPWRGEGVKEGPSVAASYLSWYDAVEFCRKLTESERRAGRLPAGRGYRLPTEAEWEYACRAGTKTKWSFGDDDRLLGDHAWFDDNAYDRAEKYAYAHEVGQKKPNPWGLLDMHGNVYEWCSDWYNKNFYKTSLSANIAASDPKGPSSAGSFRVIRGGGWVNGPVPCRSAYRLNESPSRRRLFVGFRVVVELE